MIFDKRFFLNEHYEIIECIWPLYNQVRLKGRIPDDVLRHFDCRYNGGVLAFGTMDTNSTWMIKELFQTMIDNYIGHIWIIDLQQHHGARLVDDVCWIFDRNPASINPNNVWIPNISNVLQSYRNRHVKNPR